MQDTPIVDITLDNFQSIILEQSQQRLVMVELYAEGAEACAQLSPVLAQLANEYYPHLLLARVDCHAQAQIAAQFGARSVPTVVLVQNGQLADSFVGVLPEAEIRAKLEPFLPKEQDVLYQQGRELLNQAQAEQAFALLARASGLAPERGDIRLALADSMLQLNKVEAAAEQLQQISLADQDSHYHDLMAQLDLKQAAAKSPEIQALEQSLAHDPDNQTTRYQLAMQLHQVGRNEEALELLLPMIQKPAEGINARDAYVDILRTLPAGDKLASTYRNRLFSLLY